MKKYNGKRLKMALMQLFYAISNKNYIGLRTILQAGINPNIVFLNGWAAIHFAATDTRALDLVLEFGGNVNRPSVLTGDTAFHLAVASDNYSCVELCIHAGANPFIKNFLQLLPTDLVQQHWWRPFKKRTVKHLLDNSFRYLNVLETRQQALEMEYFYAFERAGANVELQVDPLLESLAVQDETTLEEENEVLLEEENEVLLEEENEVLLEEDAAENTVLEVLEENITEITSLPAIVNKEERAYNSMQEKIIDFVQCCICLDTMKNPVSLPCGHSFCFACITLVKQKNHPASAFFSCPVDRYKFANTFPLRINYTLQKIIEAV